jgi:hypothetical protein
MSDHLSVLEKAISDVGYWRWWAEALPNVFQVEFGGVLLYFPARSPEVPPDNVIALSFRDPSLVAFLTAADATLVEPDWRIALHEDQHEPFTVDHELFTLTSETVLEAVAAGCAAEYVVGTDLNPKIGASGPLLAFRAQGVGLIVRASEMAVVTAAGELSPEQIKAAAGDWWKYWREYWDRRDSTSPMPKDYACEATIPLTTWNEEMGKKGRES